MHIKYTISSTRLLHKGQCFNIDTQTLERADEAVVNTNEPKHMEMSTSLSGQSFLSPSVFKWSTSAAFAACCRPDSAAIVNSV